MLRRIVLVGVFVAAKNINCVAADTQARTRNYALVNRIANSRVGRASALSSHVAFSGESRHEVGFGRLFGQYRAPRNGLAHCLHIFSTGVQKQVYMCVNQPGQQCRIAEVDHLDALRMVHRCSHRLDAFADDENFTWGEDVAGVYLEKPCSMEDNRCG